MRERVRPGHMPTNTANSELARLFAKAFLRVLRRHRANQRKHGQLAPEEILPGAVESRCYRPRNET